MTGEAIIRWLARRGVLKASNLSEVPERQALVAPIATELAAPVVRPIAPAGAPLRLQPVDLETELTKSELKPEQLNMLRNHSKGVMTIYDFLQTLSQSTRGGYSLGLTNYMDIYEALSKGCDLTKWMDAYIKLFGDKNERTGKFLDHITAEGKPIVFFVPGNIFTHGAAGVTRREMEWLMAHPERMKNVYFVFGAYSTISEADFIAQRLPQEESVALIADMFNHFKDYLQGPKAAAPEMPAAAMPGIPDEAIKRLASMPLTEGQKEQVEKNMAPKEPGVGWSLESEQGLARNREISNHQMYLEMPKDMSDEEREFLGAVKSERIETLFKELGITGKGDQVEALRQTSDEILKAAENREVDRLLPQIAQGERTETGEGSIVFRLRGKTMRVHNDAGGIQLYENKGERALTVLVKGLENIARIREATGLGENVEFISPGARGDRAMTGIKALNEASVSIYPAAKTAEGMVYPLPAQVVSVVGNTVVCNVGSEIILASKEDITKYVKEPMNEVGALMKSGMDREMFGGEPCYIYGLGDVPTDEDGTPLALEQINPSLSGVKSAANSFVMRERLGNVNFAFVNGIESAKAEIKKMLGLGIKENRIRCSMSDKILTELEGIEKDALEKELGLKAGELNKGIGQLLMERTKLLIIKNDKQVVDGKTVTLALPFGRIVLEGLAKLNLENFIQQSKEPINVEKDASYLTAVSTWARSIGLLTNNDLVAGEIIASATKKDGLDFIAKTFEIMLPPIVKIYVQGIINSFKAEREVLRAL